MILFSFFLHFKKKNLNSNFYFHFPCFTPILRYQSMNIYQTDVKELYPPFIFVTTPRNTNSFLGCGVPHSSNFFLQNHLLRSIIKFHPLPISSN